MSTNSYSNIENLDLSGVNETLDAEVRNIMAQFQQWVESVRLLVQSAKRPETLKVSNIADELNANINVKAMFDKYGHAIAEGMTCPVCGKHQKYLTPGGYCSYECFMKDCVNKAMSYLQTPNDKYKWFTEKITLISRVLDQTSLMLNMIVIIPDLLKSLAKLPDKYKDYVNVKINECFCALRMSVDSLLIKKNNYIKSLLSKVDLGFIPSPLLLLFQPLQTIQGAIDVLRSAFEATYTGIIKALQSVGVKLAGLGIPAGGFACMFTPRSFISPMPYTAPDMSKMFVNLPGGSGLQDISLVKPLMPNSLITTDISQINEIVKKAFPPLTTADYYLDPDVFAVRYKLSSEGDLAIQLAQMLEDYLSAGPDYLPKFANMLPVKEHSINGVNIPLPNVGYVWFILGLLDAWAPHSQALFGSILNPAL